ncbi:MAG: hypothetical protein ABR981_04715 [Candidatus Micrarchaeaceae archaeon]
MSSITIGAPGALVKVENMRAANLLDLLKHNYVGQENDLNRIAKGLDDVSGRRLIDEVINPLQGFRTDFKTHHTGYVLLFGFFAQRLPKNGNLDLSKYAIDKLAEITLIEPDSVAYQYISIFSVNGTGGAELYAIDVASKNGLGKVLEKTFLELLKEDQNNDDVYYKGKYLIDSMINGKYWTILVDVVSASANPRFEIYAAETLSDSLTTKDLEKLSEDIKNSENWRIIEYICLKCRLDVAQLALDAAADRGRIGIVANAVDKRRKIRTAKATNAIQKLLRD